MNGYADVRWIAGSWPKAFRGSIDLQKAVGWFAGVAAFASIWLNWQNSAGNCRSQVQAGARLRITAQKSMESCLSQ